MSFKIVRTEYTDSTHRFYVPPTSKSDFVNLLNTQIDNFTGTYEILSDWYAQFEDGYEPMLVRGTYYPIDWKSKIGNSDMSNNFKIGYGDDFPVLEKGDMLINEKGEVMILNWMVSRHINNQASQAMQCNARQTIERWVEDKLDDEAMIVRKAHFAKVCDNLPCGFTPYQGRPDFTKANNAPGVTADSLYNGQVQQNKMTRDIRVGDEFTYGMVRYRIINVDWSETNADQTRGILNLGMRRVAGGDSHEI